ncbi:MAG: RNA-binding protein [Planctomycetota bacterium]
MKFYVGNLNFRITEDELRELFEPYGPIDDLIILHDRETGRSRGFGFITLADDEKAKQAYDELNQKDFAGRTLVMNEARPRTERPQGGGYGGQRDNAGGGGGYGGGSRGGYAPRPSGGGYSNQTYGTKAGDSSDENSGGGGGYSGGSSEQADAGGDGSESTGGYSRGDAN